MALESPKIDICQNWPRRVLGDVIRCLESKFDKKIPMGSVPNCRKEIPTRHAIRWFRCKLKPPKKGRASTRVHDPFSDNLKIWPTFIYRGEVPGYTFAKLPVHVLINDPKKLDPKSSLQPQTHHLVMWPTSTSRSQNFGTSPKLPVCALINDPQKKVSGIN